MRPYLEPQVKVFASSHPSPRSLTKTAGEDPAIRGSNPFVYVNNWLQRSGAKPVDWTLVD